MQSLSNSTISITRESCRYLSESSVSGQPTIKLISSRLSSMIDIVTHRILPFHFIWFNSSNLNNTRLTESLRYGMLEVQEHLETFCDKKDQAMIVSFDEIIKYLNYKS